MDLLDEVTRDENFERNVRFFKRLLYVAVCVLVTGLVFMWWYTSYTNKAIQERIEHSDKFFKAMLSSEDNKFKALDLIINTQKSLPSTELAHLYLIVLKIKAGDSNDAKALLQKVVENKSYNHLTTHYAAYLLLSLGIDNENLLTEADMIKYFDMFNDKKAALKSSAMVLKGLWLHKNDKFAEAKVVLKTVYDENRTKNNFLTSTTKALLSNINTYQQDQKFR